jgi:hypothetical protein
MRKHLTRKRVTLLSIAALAVGIGTGAYAYFTTSGSGTGHATVGSAPGLTVTPTDVSPDQLYPGGPSYAVDGTVANGGSVAQQLNRLDAAIQAPSNTGSDGSKPDCTADDFALSTPGTDWVIDTSTTAHLLVNQEVAAAGQYDWTGLMVAMVNRSDASPGDGSGNQDNCQGATVNVEFTVS